jgi:hypothetical protein
VRRPSWSCHRILFLVYHARSLLARAYILVLQPHPINPWHSHLRTAGLYPWLHGRSTSLKRSPLCTRCCSKVSTRDARQNERAAKCSRQPKQRLGHWRLAAEMEDGLHLAMRDDVHVLLRVSLPPRAHYFGLHTTHQWWEMDCWKYRKSYSACICWLLSPLMLLCRLLWSISSFQGPVAPLSCSARFGYVLQMCLSA